MISIDWKKGNLSLKGGLDTILMENALIVSGIARILQEEGYKESDLKEILLNQVENGIKMAADTDYISDAKYERGAN